MEKFLPPDAQSKIQIEDLPTEGTLFEFDSDAAHQDMLLEKRIEHIVDTEGISYADAYRREGVTPPVELVESDPDDAIAVRLTDRAVAIEAIMKHYSRRNQAQGVSAVRSIGGNAFDRRYGADADAVEQHMRARVDHPSLYQSMNVLVAAEAMRANGYSEDEIHEQKRALEDDFTPIAGPGKSTERNKVVRKVAKTAQIAKQASMNNVA